MTIICLRVPLDSLVSGWQKGCNCNRGGHGESSKEISLEWSDIGCDIQSEEDQVDDETPTPNTISDSEGDARAGTRGKQLLLVVYYPYFATTVNNVENMDYSPNSGPTHYSLGETLVVQKKIDTTKQNEKGKEDKRQQNLAIESHHTGEANALM